jgi:hypothetical protein
MLQVHLFGTLRRFAPQPGATDESIVMIPWCSGTCVMDIIREIGIPQEEVGEIFVNYSPVDIYAPVPDDARIGLFSHCMRLLCGGQHLKGHGFITTPTPHFDYWTQFQCDQGD